MTPSTRGPTGFRVPKLGSKHFDWYRQKHLDWYVRNTSRTTSEVRQKYVRSTSETLQELRQKYVRNTSRTTSEVRQKNFKKYVRNTSRSMIVLSVSQGARTVPLEIEADIFSIYQNNYFLHFERVCEYQMEGPKLAHGTT